MSERGINGTSMTVDEAYQEGRRAGLAAGALAASLVAFVSLLGLEKAILGGVLAIAVLRRARPNSAGRKLGRAALVIACVYTLMFFVVLVVFREKLWMLLRQLQQLG